MNKVLMFFTTYVITICGVLGSTLSTSFRHGLQFSYEMLDAVNRVAIEASEKPEEQLDIVISGIPAGKSTQFGQTQIYAFKDMKFGETCNIDVLLGRMRAYEHEIILTGYGKGANFAAKVARELSKYVTKDNKIKLFAFCADKIIEDKLDGISMLSRIHFSRYTEWQCRNSSMIEFPETVMKSLVDKFSLPGFIAGVTACVFGWEVIQRFDWSRIFEIIPIGSALWCSFCEKPQKYLTMADIWSKYEFAKYRLSFAPPEEYKDLGLP